MPDNFKQITRYVILCQCAGMIPYQLFQNGIFLTFMKDLGISESLIIIFIQSPNILGALLLIPLAYKADMLGKKKLGQIGNVLQLLALLIFAAIPLYKESTLLLMILAFFVLSVGSCLFNGGWFALLVPLVEEKRRAPFFGILRLTWQIVGLVLTWLAMKWIGMDDSLSTYQSLLLVVAALMLFRIYYYQKIPEVETHRPEPKAFKELWGMMKEREGFVWFNFYIFLLGFSVTTVGNLFNLQQRTELNFSNELIVNMGLLYFAGACFGFIFSGILTIKLGSNRIFNLFNFSAATLLIVMSFHHLLPVSDIVSMGAAGFIFGAMVSVHGVSHTVAMFDSIPKEFKSVSTATCITTVFVAAGCSALLTAQLLKLDLTNPYLNKYQCIILFYGVMIFTVSWIFLFKPAYIKRQSN